MAKNEPFGDRPFDIVPVEKSLSGQAISPVVSGVQAISPVVSGVTTEYIHRRVKVHYVMDHELETLKSATFSVSLTFLGVCIGSAISFACVIFTQELSTGGHAAFLTLFCVSIVLSIYFGGASIKKFFESRNLVTEIRGREAPPEVH